MKNDKDTPMVISSISEQHRMLSLPKPQHPLVSVFNFADILYGNEELDKKFSLNFYCIAIKKNFKGKLKYGQQYYDFDEGVMSFISPRQLLCVEEDGNPTEGFCLMFHPDLIAGYPLASKIKSYGFFSYALHEALHLSDKEEAMVEGIMKNINNEIHQSIDHFSQDVIVSHIELLLNYSNRFYNRQFITRKAANQTLLTKLEAVLSDYFDGEEAKKSGLLTVQYVSGKLHVSANYLSDVLRALTGQSTQLHIHNKVIEKAKEVLTTTDLSVSEIAYRLGFEYPQSFNKLFKNKTALSPLEFRQSFK